MWVVVISCAALIACGLDSRMILKERYPTENACRYNSGIAVMQIVGEGEADYQIECKRLRRMR